MAKFSVNGTEYEVPTNLTLGEMRAMKQATGVKFSDMGSFDDPDVLVGLLFVAMRRVDPSVTVEQLDAVGIDAFKIIGDEPEQAADVAEEAPAGPPADAGVAPAVAV